MKRHNNIKLQIIGKLIIGLCCSYFLYHSHCLSYNNNTQSNAPCKTSGCYDLYIFVTLLLIILIMHCGVLNPPAMIISTKYVSYKVIYTFTISLVFHRIAFILRSVLISGRSVPCSDGRVL